MARKGLKVKTQVGDLKYVFITGEGRNNAMKGQEPRMQFVASIVTKKDSPLHKNIKAQVDAEWKAYKEAFNVKGLPKSTGIKDLLMPDPKGTIDPETEEVAKVPSGDVIITFKTSTTWPDGNAKQVKVYDHKGSDISAAVLNAGWGIGEGSKGIIHGVAQGNNTGDKQKVTLYLNAVQLSKLVKYEGDSIDAEEIEGEDIDLGEDAVAAISEEETPNL